MSDTPQFLVGSYTLNEEPPKGLSFLRALGKPVCKTQWIDVCVCEKPRCLGLNCLIYKRGYATGGTEHERGSAKAPRMLCIS